jgi:hypothetical protein
MTMISRSVVPFFFAAAILVAGSAVDSLAEDGGTKDSIVFGQVAALDGPAQALGKVFSRPSARRIAAVESKAASSN